MFHQTKYLMKLQGDEIVWFPPPHEMASFIFNRARQMEWLSSPETYQHACELVCCFFTMIAVFASYVFTMRV